MQVTFACLRHEFGYSYFSGIACCGGPQAIAAEAAPTIVISNVGAASAAIVEQRLRFYGTVLVSDLFFPGKIKSDMFFLP